MNINLKFYKENNESLTKEEQDIEKYILETPKEKYDKIIEKDTRTQTIFALSEMRENIINWYPFKENSNILEIGSNFGEITGLLCEKAIRVVAIEKKLKKAECIKKRHEKEQNLEVIVGKLEDIKLDEKFNYVILNGILEFAPNYIEAENPFEEILQYAKQMLKPDGKILIATDNKFGIQYWAGKKYIDGSNEYKGLSEKFSKKQPQLFGKRQLEELLNNMKLSYKIYNIFPNYKIPNLIYDEKYEISKEDINRNFECHDEEDIVNFIENNVLFRIIKEEKNIFNFFINSYFIEIGQNEIKNDIRYITFTNYRKKEYKIVTIIKENEVIKKAITKEAQNHINQMIHNLQYLKEYNITPLEKQNDNIVISPFIKNAKRLDYILENIKTLEEFKITWKPYIDMLYKNTINYEDINIDKTSQYIKQYDISKLKNMKFLKHAFIDLIPKNIFIIDNKLEVFDQEWMKEYLPVEYIIYRGICNLNIQDNLKHELMEEYLLENNIDLFEQLENEFREKVMDKNILYNIFYKKPKTQAEILSTLVHYRNLKAITEQELEKERQSKEHEIKIRDEQINNLIQEVNNLKNSKCWKLIEFIRRAKGTIK